MFKYARCIGLAELLKVFQNITRTGTVPREWSNRLTMSLYKVGSTAVWEVQREEVVKHCMKIRERVLHKRLK